LDRFLSSGFTFCRNGPLQRQSIPLCGESNFRSALNTAAGTRGQKHSYLRIREGGEEFIFWIDFYPPALLSAGMGHSKGNQFPSVGNQILEAL
jgi:hypothetical protein